MSSIKNAKGLKIVFWNAQSQTRKLFHITEMLQENDIDVLIISESWLRADIDDNSVKVNNYLICRQDRAAMTNYNITKRGGGICIYIKNTIPFTELCDQLYKCNTDDLELVTVRLNIEKLRPILICAVYRPPSGCIATFNNHIISLLDNLSTSRKYDLYLGGDFNIDYLKPSPNRKYLKDLENSFSLMQVITEKTRPLYSNTIVDLIFTNNQADSTSGTLDLNVSDHLPTWIIRKKVKVKPITSEFIGRTYKNYNMNTLREKLLQINWQSYFREEDLNKAWDMFMHSILPILDSICPIRKSRYTNSRPQWITNELMELANDRDRAMKLAKRDPSPVNIAKAKSLRNEAKIAFKTIREEYIKSKLEEFKGDPKKFWNELNNVIPGNKCRSNEVFNLLDSNSTALSNDVAATYVNTYFSTIGSALAANIGKLNLDEQNFLNEHQRRHLLDLNQLHIDLFTLEEVIVEINNINIYKSSGINNISSRILKDIWQIYPELLLNILNKAIQLGNFPNVWKHGTVIPIPKIPNPQQVGDLRPITLLPLPGKIMERLIHNKLYPYLEENGILTPRQNGFRKQHGTPDTIFKLITQIIDNINKKKVTVAVFIDFKKAFDTLDHTILIQKLSKINISPTLLKWFGSYLTGRSQVTYMNSCTSPTATLTHGVPQGSILGPMLFNLYINDLPEVVLSDMILYADDSVLFASANSLQEACQKVQKDLAGIGTWCSYHKLSINTNKTKAMQFGVKNTH